jgi:hypothetical protein
MIETIIRDAKTSLAHGMQVEEQNFSTVIYESSISG